MGAAAARAPGGNAAPRRAEGGLQRGHRPRPGTARPPPPKGQRRPARDSPSPGWRGCAMRTAAGSHRYNRRLPPEPPIRHSAVSTMARGTVLAGLRYPKRVVRASDRAFPCRRIWSSAPLKTACLRQSLLTLPAVRSSAAPPAALLTTGSAVQASTGFLRPEDSPGGRPVPTPARPARVRAGGPASMPPTIPHRPPHMGVQRHFWS